MKRSFYYGVIGAAAAVMVSGPAMARDTNEMTDLRNWNYETLKDGWMASSLIDAEVRGSNGEEIGDVLNLVLDSEGKLKSVIVEAGGILDIGDNHFRVPWSEVDVGPDHESVTVPIEAGNVDEYTLFDGERIDRKVAENSYRATELVRSFVSLDDRKGFGMVTDLVFNDQDSLEAVVAQPTYGAGRTGYYALPYMQGTYSRSTGSWTFPYSDQDIKILKSFEPANLY